MRRKLEILRLRLQIPFIGFVQRYNNPFRHSRYVFEPPDAFLGPLLEFREPDLEGTMHALEHVRVSVGTHDSDRHGVDTAQVSACLHVVNVSAA